MEVELLGVGFPRTGSTALAALLGEDTSHPAAAQWEARRRARLPASPPRTTAARLATAEAQHRRAGFDGGAAAVDASAVGDGARWRTTT